MKIRRLIGKLLAWGNQLFPAKGPGYWKSKIFPVSVRYNGSWALIRPVLDTDEKLFIGLTGSNDLSYSIKITTDVSKEIVSEVGYLTDIQDQMLGDNESNLMLGGKTRSFHQAEFVMQEFSISTRMKGRMNVRILVRRNGYHSIIIQMGYPSSQFKGIDTIPNQLHELDRGIQIFE